MLSVGIFVMMGPPHGKAKSVFAPQVSGVRRDGCLPGHGAGVSPLCRFTAH